MNSFSEVGKIACYVSLGYVIVRFLVKLIRPRFSSSLPLPPGPKPKSYIYDLLNPSEGDKVWIRAARLANEYGDVVHEDVNGVHTIYLNTYEAATDLLEKRSSKYSSRHPATLVEMMGTRAFLTNLPYGSDWRLGRRIFHQDFNSNSSSQFKDVQMKYARAILPLLKMDPDSFTTHLKYFSAGIIVDAIYGLNVESMDDPIVRKLEASFGNLEELEGFGTWIEMFPLWKYAPSWLPGGGFRAAAKRQGIRVIDSVFTPFSIVVDSFKDGYASHSFVAAWLSKLAHQPEEHQERISKAVKFVAGTAFLAGYETTLAALLNFILLMVLHPTVQQCAQLELDTIVGRNHLASFHDRENLPYMIALFKEVMRYYPVAPLGLPHEVTVDDTYKGMRIPKGAMVIGNAWNISRNEDEYGTDADTFNPDRFLEKERRDPTQYVFGFGRRICPGRYLAENSIFIAMCTILQVFSIEKKKDDSGIEIPVEANFSGTGMHPEPFFCTFKLRYEGAEKLLDIV